MSEELNDRQRFKAAFIARCIEHGVTDPDEIVGKVKEAREKLAFIGQGAVGAGINTLGDFSMLGLGAAAIAPPALGYLAGSALGRSKNLNDIDVEEVKKQELIDELRRNTERLRRHRAQSREVAQAGGHSLM